MKPENVVKLKEESEDTFAEEINKLVEKVELLCKNRRMYEMDQKMQYGG